MKRREDVAFSISLPPSLLRLSKLIPTTDNCSTSPVRDIQRGIRRILLIYFNFIPNPLALPNSSTKTIREVEEVPTLPRLFTQPI